MQQTVDDTPSLSQDYVLERLARAAYAWDCSLSGSAEGAAARRYMVRYARNVWHMRLPRKAEHERLMFLPRKFVARHVEQLFWGDHEGRENDPYLKRIGYNITKTICEYEDWHGLVNDINERVDEAFDDD